MPKIRHFETHPFTIVSTSPNLELVISAYDGFTSDLHDYAVKNPGAALHASIDGPYGALPDFSKSADKLVLIAGGSGASFTFGVALDTIKRLAVESTMKIDFIWTVREEGKYSNIFIHVASGINYDIEAITWFAKELDELRLSPRVNLLLHTTRPSSGNTSGTQTPLSPQVDEEKSIVFSPSISNPSVTSPSMSSPSLNSSTKTPFKTGDIEKQDAELALGIPRHHHTHPWDSSVLDVVHGRPDIAALIKDIVSKTDKSQRIAIAGCGPDNMMNVLRKSATEAISVSGPSIEFHSESFGW